MGRGYHTLGKPSVTDCSRLRVGSRDPLQDSLWDPGVREGKKSFA
jgi:hypothetical protein